MKIGVIHANSSAVKPLETAFQSIDPSVEVINFVNEEMLHLVDTAGGITLPALRLFAREAFKAADAQVDAIMVACSVFCSRLDVVRPFLDVPIIAVDDAAIATAVERGGKIGIISTTAAAAPTSQGKLSSLAEERGVSLTFSQRIVTGAMTALKAGDVSGHDRLILGAAKELAEEGCSTIFLCQITMARAKAAFLDELAAMTLTTPEEGVRAVLSLVNERRSV